MTSTQRKKEIFAEFGGSETNTGSAHAQVALFTERINEMSEHLKIQKKDHATRLSLIKLVGKRKKLLRYIAKNDIQDYRDLIKKLGLRK